MTGRERLLTALEGGKPDHLPCQVHGWMDCLRTHDTAQPEATHRQGARAVYPPDGGYMRWPSEQFVHGASETIRAFVEAAKACRSAQTGGWPPRQKSKCIKMLANLYFSAIIEVNQYNAI